MNYGFADPAHNNANFDLYASTVIVDHCNFFLTYLLIGPLKISEQVRWKGNGHSFA